MKTVVGSKTIYEFDKLARGDLDKGNGSSGAPAAPSAPSGRTVLGLPLEKVEEVLAACPGHLSGPGRNALAKALDGNARERAQGERELNDVLGQAVEIVRNRQFTKAFHASRGTLTRTGFVVGRGR